MTLFVVDSKRCSRCKEVKLFSAFTSTKWKPDGLHNYCRVCRTAYRVEREAAKGWRRLEDEAMPTGEILVHLADGRTVNAAVHPNILVVDGRFAFDMPRITHWRPMIDGPKDAP